MWDTEGVVDVVIDGLLLNEEGVVEGITEGVPSCVLVANNGVVFEEVVETSALADIDEDVEGLATSLEMEEETDTG